MKASRSAVLAALLVVLTAAEQTATVWLPQLNIGDVQLNANSGAVVKADDATATLVLSDPSGQQFTATYVSKTILTLDVRTVNSNEMTVSIAAACTLGSEGGSAQCSGKFRQTFEGGGTGMNSDFGGNRRVQNAVVTITQGSLPTGSGSLSASPGAGGGGSDMPSATTIVTVSSQSSQSSQSQQSSHSSQKGGAAPLGGTNMLSGGAAAVAVWFVLLF